MQPAGEPKTTKEVLSVNDKAREMRREYKREWNRRNKDKVKAAQERYWQKKAAAAEQETQTDEPTITQEV